jgi:hypothetical protein
MEETQGFQAKPHANINTPGTRAAEITKRLSGLPLEKSFSQIINYFF